MALFKKEEAKPLGTPTDKVLQLRQQNMSDNQIVEQMQREKYSSQDIFNALKQADLRAQNQPQMPPPDMGGPNMPPPQNIPVPEPEAPAPNMPPPQNNPNPTSETFDVDKIEEIAESIIDEKWDDLVKNVNKIIDWKAEIESRISDLEEKNEHLQANFDKLHKAILSKIDDYDKTLLNVGSEIKAMNQVFQKILPTFTENVQTLERITKKLNKKKK